MRRRGRGCCRSEERCIQGIVSPPITPTAVCRLTQLRCLRAPEKRKMYVDAFNRFLDTVPFLRPALAILDERPHDVIMLGNFVCLISFASLCPLFHHLFS